MVNKGYKKTEIGIIPEDWDLCSLEHNFDFYQNNTYARNCMNDISGMVRNIHYGDVLIKYGAILDCDKESIPFINSGISVNTVNRTIQSGDIIMADTAEDETVGKAVEVVNVGSKVIVSGLHTFFIRPHADLFAQRYLGYFINASVYHDQLLPHIVGTKVSSISKKSLNETFVLCPGLPEQRRIAEALSDIDTLISNLEKLIAKKRAIKQGAMQELLTGKLRLTGFEGKWVKKRVGSIGNTYSGLTGKTKEHFGVGNARYITFLNVLMNTVIDTTILERVIIGETENQNAVRCGDLFFNTSSETPEEVGMCAVLTKEISNTYLNSFCFGFRLTDEEIDGLFLSYYFNSNCGRTIMYLLAQGATRYNLSKTYFNDVVLLLPTKPEQTAIAEILSDMDAEIDALTAKLNKLQKIKQGMMNELLTGRIRFTDSVPAKATAEAYPEQEVEPIRKVAEDTAPKGHNQQFDDAVAIAAIVNTFYSDKYPLGRKKVQKLLYLLRRKQNACITAFKKKAAGPYADEVRYKGGEPIAKRNNYVIVINSKRGSMFAKGKDIGKALDYVAKWNMQPELDWLVEQFVHTKVDKLELLATIDMAMCDLDNSGVTLSVDSVKRLIATDKEWKAKLKKTYFSDADIGWAITECMRMFNTGGK